MKIKVIDLLNKIANGEELPQQIKIYDEIFVCCSGVRFKNKDGELLGEVYPIEVMLDEKVEIIEEEPEIDIHEIKNLEYVEDYEADKTDIRLNRDKINELIRAIKQIDKKLKGE